MKLVSAPAVVFLPLWALHGNVFHPDLHLAGFSVCWSSAVSSFTGSIHAAQCMWCVNGSQQFAVLSMLLLNAQQLHLTVVNWMYLGLLNGTRASWHWTTCVCTIKFSYSHNQGGSTLCDPWPMCTPKPGVRMHIIRLWQGSTSRK